MTHRLEFALLAEESAGGQLSPPPIDETILAMPIQQPPPWFESSLCDPNHPTAAALHHLSVLSTDHHAESDSSNRNSTRPRLLCLTYTISTAHAGRVAGIHETWVKGCDGYIAMSNITDPLIPSVAVIHDGPESYFNMWQKVGSLS